MVVVITAHNGNIKTEIFYHVNAIFSMMQIGYNKRCALISSAGRLIFMANDADLGDLSLAYY